MDVTALTATVRARQASAVEVAEAALARVATFEPHLHAFCASTPELTRAEAARVDCALAAGEPGGSLAGVPLAGVPYDIKEFICTKDVRTMSGSPAYAEFVPNEDDVVIERMREAGAVSLSKTNVLEFGCSCRRSQSSALVLANRAGSCSD